MSINNSAGVEYPAKWAEIEGNAPAAKRYAVAGAIGEANADARFRGEDENAADSPVWAAVAVKAYREIAGAR